MGHASHFLERLDRLSRVHTEEALLLYNQAPLLKDVLDLARVPDGVARVAIALGEHGPYVVVTRDGAFVTCLGEGMSTKSLPIISRTQLDAFAVKHVELRRQMRRAAELAESDDQKGAELLARAERVGPMLTRDLFMSLLPWLPIVDVAMLRAMQRCIVALGRARDGLNEKNGYGTRSLYQKTLRSYWDVFWSTANLMSLLSALGSTMLHRLPVERRRTVIEQLPAPLILEGVLGPAARAAIATARLGEGVLDTFAEPYERCTDTMSVYLNALPLLALGARHPEHQRDVLSVLSAPGVFSPSGRVPGLKHDLSSMAQKIFDDPDLASENAILFARREVIERAIARRGPLPSRDLLDDIDLLKAVVATSTRSIYGEEGMGTWLVAITMWLAPTPAEDLFAPERLLPHVSFGDWRPELSQSLLILKEVRKVAEPVRAEERPGRNDPCPCGSGKKHKKCCG